MLDDNSITYNKYYNFKDIDKNTSIFLEYDNISKQLNEQVIKWYKFKDRKVLSRLSIRQLKNLIERCREVIEEKIREDVNKNNS